MLSAAAAIGGVQETDGRADQSPQVARPATCAAAVPQAEKGDQCHSWGTGRGARVGNACTCHCCQAQLGSHTTRLDAYSAPGMQDLQRLQDSLHFIGAPAASSRTVFVDGSEALQSTAAQQELGSRSEDSAAAANGDASGAAVPDRAAARRAKRRVTAYRQLLEAREEAERVEQLAARLRAAKVAASNGRRRKQPAGSGGGLAAVPQFKRVRQR